MGKKINDYNKNKKMKNHASIKYITQTIADGVVGLGINDEGNVKNSLIKLLYK